MRGKNLRIIWDNRQFDQAILSASSETETMGAVNLQDKVRTRPWRTQGVSGEWLAADMRAAVHCTCLALLNHNFTYGAQLTVQTSATADFAVVKEQTFDLWPDIIGAGEGGAGEHGAGGAFLETERSFYTKNPIRLIYFDLTDEEFYYARYWRVQFTDPANPDGYFQIGRLYLCLYDDYARQFGYGWDYDGEDDSNIDRAENGTPWTQKRPARRVLRLPWKAFRIEDKYWRFLFFRDQVGLSQDFIIDATPGASMPSERHFMTMYGRFRSYPKLTAVSGQASELEIEFVESH